MTIEETLSEAAAVNATTISPPTLEFTVGTLLTNAGQYERMLRSFLRHGFDRSRTQYLYIDNRSGNVFDAYRGLTHLLARSSGRYVILCHQDVELVDDGCQELRRRIEEINELDPNWAVAGNAGWRAGRFFRCISDPHGDRQLRGPLPAAVDTLDENFLVVRRDAMIGFSNDLSGFHLYGTDLCQQARLRGYSSWVLPFHLKHHSGGRLNRSFFDALSSFEGKYSRISRPMLVRTTCRPTLIGGAGVRVYVRRLRRSPAVYRFARYVPLVRRLFGDGGEGA